MVKEQDPDNKNRFDQTKKAVEERDQFLREHPELLSFQEEINEVMRKAGSNANRMTQLDILLREKTNELLNLLEQLKTAVVIEQGVDPAKHEPADQEKTADSEATEPDKNDIGRIAKSADPPGNQTHPGLILGPADAWPQKNQSQSDQDDSGNDRENKPGSEPLNDHNDDPDKNPN